MKEFVGVAGTQSSTGTERGRTRGSSDLDRSRGAVVVVVVVVVGSVIGEFVDLFDCARLVRNWVCMEGFPPDEREFV